MIEQSDLTPAATAELPSGGRKGPSVGERIGPYLLVRLLGEGSGGRVYEVLHEKLDRRAALKLLDAAQAERPAARARFFAEALSITRINHPHIVEVTDIVETTQHAGLVMELLEGVSLGTAMREGPLPPERFLRILAEVCEGLAAAHAAGFVHRDLKPENVFLCDRHGVSDFVKVLDFGVAAPLPARTPTGLLSGSGATSSGLRRAAFVGTPAYASPEQASGSPVDRTTDLYAVGVMLYELACGRLPFEGWTAGQLLIQHLSAPVPRLPVEMCATPLGRALDAIVQGCMAKAPHDRFSSATELGAKLAALARGESISIVTPRTLFAPPRRLRAVALATAGLLGAFGVGSLFFERGGAEPVPVAPVAAARPAAATSVTLAFESEPAGAEVRLTSDDSLLGVTPFRHAFPRTGGSLGIEFAHAGYASVRLEISTAAPRTVSATLARSVPKKERRSSRTRQHRAAHLGSEKTINPFHR